MAPLVPMVVPLTPNARTTFLKEEAKHPVNDNCPTNDVSSTKPNANAMQLVVPRTPRQPVHGNTNITSSKNAAGDSRGGDPKSALLLLTDDRDLNGRRKVQWNDSHGKELASVWKFQPRCLTYTRPHRLLCCC